MTKWIVALIAITSLNLSAAPSKAESVIIAEFNQSVISDLKADLKQQTQQHVTVQPVTVEMPAQEAQKDELITQVNYAEPSAE